MLRDGCAGIPNLSQVRFFNYYFLYVSSYSYFIEVQERNCKSRLLSTEDSTLILLASILHYK